MSDDTTPVEGTDPEQLVSDFKKQELKAAAEVAGADVKSSDTKADLAEKIVQASGRAAPVKMDNYGRRNDDDALEGSFVKILDGEHAHQVGVFERVLEHGADGYPALVRVKFEDATYTHAFTTEPYSNVRTIRQHLTL